MRHTCTMPEYITILLPHGEPTGAATRLAPRLRTLSGKRVAFLDNDMWRSMHIAADELGKVLMGEYGVVETETIMMPPLKGNLTPEYERRLRELSGRVDAVVSGLGN